MTEDPNLDLPPLLTAGMACTRLIADPTGWINRRVETIELLSHEETRRRVSIDFSLSDPELGELEIGEGVAVPISVLTKEARRNFDLRDESGRAVPVLGRHQNGELAEFAVLNGVLNALPDVTPEAFETLAHDVRQIVLTPPETGEAALSLFLERAEAGDVGRMAIWKDDVCRSLLSTLWNHYALFAVLSPGGANRRILKYSYSDEFDLGRISQGIRERGRELARRGSRPDRRRFVVECAGGGRARSFHVEILVPEELRIETAVLYDFFAEDRISDVATNVNRASLYASRGIADMSRVAVYVEIAPERIGRTSQAATTSLIIATLLWLGVASGLDSSNPGPAVSILVAGAALFSGVTATQGEHPLVKRVFAAPRRWLFLATITALAGSATLAMEIPGQHPVALWRCAAIAATLAAVRLVWSVIRAPA